MSTRLRSVSGVGKFYIKATVTIVSCKRINEKSVDNKFTRSTTDT